MIGIYKYTNKINGKIYIGQSINLEQRQYSHRCAAFNEKTKDYNSKFHQAVRKYNGFENFDYEVIMILTPEEYTKKLLDELETFFINYYDSYKNGYNATKGGDDNPSRAQKGEKNGRALLTLKDVEYIRECYNAHVPFRTIYREYQHKISKRGLQKVWWFDTWKDVHPEYHTEENRYWHSHQAKANSSEVASQNQRKFNPDEIRTIRSMYAAGLTPKKIWLQYSDRCAWSTIYNIITNQSYKDIK